MGAELNRSSRHVRLYRRLVGLAPRAHRDRYGDDQVDLFADLIDNGHTPWRLWAAALPDLWSVLSSSSRRTVMSHLARLALVPLSLLNIAAGLALAGVAIATSAVPLWVSAPASAIAIQGGFALLWLSGRVPWAPYRTTIMFATGEALALVAGTLGLVVAIIEQSGSTDAEYGPPTMMVFVTLHAAIGLLCWPGQRPDPVATTS